MDLQSSVAYGTTYTTNEDAYKNVSQALDAGYRVLNTCAAYGNEKGIGRAIANFPREGLTIFSLDSNSARSSIDFQNFDGYRATLRQVYRTLEDLSIPYIDCYMINWPVPRYMESVWRQLNADSWRAMEDCVKNGLIRHIGVSNFLPLHLCELQKTAVMPIEVNQLEIHPSFQQRETVQFCKTAGMCIMAWSPLFKGRAVAIPKIVQLAEKYQRTPAQIILRWDIQRGITPVVSSTNKERMKSNFDIFSFELSEEDMCIIDNLENGEHIEAFSYTRQQKSLKEHQNDRTGTCKKSL